MKRLTTPEVLNLSRRLYPTGNHFVTLPLISGEDGSVDRVGLLHEGLASLIEFGGREAQLGAETLPPLEPLLRPFVVIGERRLEPAPGELSWSRLWGWVPAFEWRIGRGSASGPVVKGTIFAPVWRGREGLRSHKGFVYLFETEGLSGAVGLSLVLSDLVQTVYTSRRLPTSFSVREDRWTGGPVIEPSSGGGVGPGALAVAFSGEPQDVEWTLKDAEGGPAGRAIRLDFVARPASEPGRGGSSLLSFAFYFGVNREGDGARTSAVDLARRGSRALLAETGQALEAMCLRVDPAWEDAGVLEERLNLNLFFNCFFAAGRTIDKENLVLVTSRSPLYYVSAAFWARDALLWSFPGLLLADPRLAEEAIGAAFERYFAHAGIHSLYLDGTLLYPGFELDELASYPIALWRYVRATGDKAILARRSLGPKLERLMDLLDEEAHPDPSIHLYRTFLLPSDDPATHPYVTYDNVLAWRALLSTADLLEWAAGVENGVEGDRPACLRRKAALVRSSIQTHCRVPVPGGKPGERMYAWSTDLAGGTEVGDEPPGSLELVAYYGFCPRDDEVWLNTVRWLGSRANPYRYAGVPFPGLGCPHAKHPFVMSLFNALLGGLEDRVDEARRVLARAPLDTGIACESFDRETGEVRTGAAFATCAGFLAYAMDKAFRPGSRGPGEARNDDWPVEQMSGTR